MSDFLLDFRDERSRRSSAAKSASLLKFYRETRVDVLHRTNFSLVVTGVGQEDLWAPCVMSTLEGELLVALAGRIALEEDQWQVAEASELGGGLACRWLALEYRAKGLRGLEKVNGNATVLVYDESKRQVHLVTDRCGMLPVYGSEPLGSNPVLSSHPDILANVQDCAVEWDETSLAQFVMTGSVSYPHTYYASIRALPIASIHSFDVAGAQVRPLAVQPYGRLSHQVSADLSEEDLADDLAVGFRNAIRRRCNPRLGTTGVALSGGLDSRAVLAATGHDADVVVFSLYDKPNAELASSQRIAQACDLQLNLIRRDAEFYGRTAEDGVRISGGMGSLGSNHFLGARQEILDLGVSNMLTGCYCDYLFKALAINTTRNRFSRAQEFAPFQFEFYRPHFEILPEPRDLVSSRLRQRFGQEEGRALDEVEWLDVEAKRTFPLAYEGDSAQRVVPQRVLPWFLPMADKDLLETYLKIPVRFKLNGSIFRRMLLSLCSRDLLAIPDSNTGAPITSGRFGLWLHQYTSAFLNRMNAKARPGLAARGSWPNREYYIHHSPVIQDLWNRPCPAADDLFGFLFGADGFKGSSVEYRGLDAQLFMRLLTVKIWLGQRN